MTSTKSALAKTRQFTSACRCQTEPAADEPGDPTVSDPLKDAPLPAPPADRFTIQLDDIEFITVGSIETATHDAEIEVADTHRTNCQRGP